MGTSISSLVVAAEAESEEEAQTDEEKYNEMLSSIAMSRMKELGLKPPEAIANLESLPPKLGEKLDNMTEQALKQENKTKIDEKLQGNEKLIPPPPGPKKPSTNGKEESNKITVLNVPSSPGQELVEEVPGVKPLELPEEEEDEKKKKKKKDKKKEKNGQKVEPPPAQEGGVEGDSGLSVGESGEEGPAEGQDEEEQIDVPTKPQNTKKIKPKKPKTKKKKPESKPPVLPPQLKDPDVKAPQLPNNAPPPSPNFYGIPGFKKHEVKEKEPFAITFGGKKVTNIKESKDTIKSANDDEESSSEVEEEDKGDFIFEELFVELDHPLLKSCILHFLSFL